MRTRRRRSPRKATVVLAVTALGGLTGCAEAQQEKSSGTIGTNVESGGVELRNVVVAPPSDGEAYRKGEDAVVRFALFNNKPRRDVLRRVEARMAQWVNLRWDRACDGTAEQVSRIGVRSHGTVPESGDAPAGGAAYYATMKNLGGTVRPGTTTRLVFEFDKAGRIPVDALVHASNDPSLPALGCRGS